MKLFICIVLLFCLFQYKKGLPCPIISEIVNTTEGTSCIPKSYVIENCELYSTVDTSKCDTCIRGSTPSGGTPFFTACTCLSTTDGFSAQDEEGNMMCVNEIPNCLKYSKTDPTRCHTCIPGTIVVGTSPNITNCHCSTNAYRVVKDELGDLYCRELSVLVENCEIIKENGDGSQCHTCRTGAIATGTSPDITQCDCTGKNLYDSVDTNGIRICATQEIENCVAYESSSPEYCGECIPQATLVGSSPTVTGCLCEAPNILHIDDQNRVVCILEDDFIVGCEAYDSTDLSVCLRCVEESETFLSAVTGAIYMCPCKIGKQWVQNSEQEYVCSDKVIDACKYYYKYDLHVCNECYDGYVAQHIGVESKCLCQEPSQESKKNELQEGVCIESADVIQHCKEYNSADLSKCYSCTSPYSGEGTNFLFSSCICDGENPYCTPDGGPVENCRLFNEDNQTECLQCIDGVTASSSTLCECNEPKVVKIDDNGEQVCVDEIFGCAIYNRFDLVYCHTCGAEFTGVGHEHIFESCICGGGKEVMEYDNMDKVCVNVIEGCEVYAASDTSKCEQCQEGLIGAGDGEDGLFSSCGCEGSQLKVYNNLGKFTCIVSEIDGCRFYLDSDITKCFFCQYGTLPVGVQFAYTDCMSCEKSIVEDSYGGQQCGDAIFGCLVHDGSDIMKCEQCNIGFEKKEDSSECECSGVVGYDLEGRGVCVSSVILYCLNYNADDVSKCANCAQGFEGTGSSLLYSECSCGGHIVDKSDGSLLCIGSVIGYCKYYQAVGACEECELGFSKAAGNDSCGCSSDKKKKDKNGGDICVSTVIENCQKYASFNSCHVCETGFSLSDDQKLCSSSETSASSNIVQFSVILTILAIIIII